MIFGQRRIVIKQTNYSGQRRGGVEWLKRLFDHAGFILYLALALVVLYASRPPLDTSQQPLNNGNMQVINSGEPSPSAISFIPGFFGFFQSLQTNLITGSGSVVSFVGNLIYANEQNRALRQQLIDSKITEQRLTALEQENAELSKLLRFQPDKNPNFITARIIGDSGTSGRQTWLVNVGANSGIAPQAYVISDQGLVGVVTEVGRNTARVLRLSDPSFYLPITVKDRKFRAVLKGNSGPVANLDYFDGLDRPVVGEVIITTGSGGNFPPFLPIGTVYDKTLGGIGVLIYAEKNPPIYVKIYKK